MGLNERNDFATVRKLRVLWPHMGIALLTSRVHSSLVGRARSHGINAMAMTQERFSMIRRAIFAAAHGRFWYSPAVAGRTVDTGVRCARPSRTPKHVATLTPRENEVLAHLALGHSVKETARQLGLARSTVDNHKTHIMKKINVHSLAELARYAIRMGVVEP
jgi:two-component system response regulator NreC